MKARELFEAVKSVFPGTSSDTQIAAILGLTPGRISQLRKGREEIAPRTVAKSLRSLRDRAGKEALSDAIKPIVEFYPIESTESKQDKRWELLPTAMPHYPRQRALRNVLEAEKGIYFFYNSEGEAIYTGKTVKQSLWKELNDVFNRERASHQAFFVNHPTTGTGFVPAWKAIRQPRKQTIYLCDVAHYFSAYRVAIPLISSLEAMVVRAMCNDLSNKKMEKFGV